MESRKQRPINLSKATQAPPHHNKQLPNLQHTTRIRATSHFRLPQLQSDMAIDYDTLRKISNGNLHNTCYYTCLVSSFI